MTVIQTDIDDISNTICVVPMTSARTHTDMAHLPVQLCTSACLGVSSESSSDYLSRTPAHFERRRGAGADFTPGDHGFLALDFIGLTEVAGSHISAITKVQDTLCPSQQIWR